MRAFRMLGVNHFLLVTVLCIATLDNPPKSETTFKDVVTMTTDVNRLYSMCFERRKKKCVIRRHRSCLGCRSPSRTRFKVGGAARSYARLSRFFTWNGCMCL